MVYFTVRPSFISSLFLLFLLFAVSSYAAKVVEVDFICNQTSDPSFCSTLLNSMPGGAIGADLDTLGKYTFDGVSANVSNIINQIKELIAKSDQDFLAKYHYKYCLGSFLCAQSDIEYAQELLESKDYSNIGFALVDISLSADNCLVIPPRYKDPSVLPKYVEFVKQVDQIIRVIYLLQG